MSGRMMIEPVVQLSPGVDLQTAVAALTKVAENVAIVRGRGAAPRIPAASGLTDVRLNCGPRSLPSSHARTLRMYADRQQIANR
jgi:hypothetical protein